MNWYLSVFKNYATFSGRARRTEYWMFLLFHAIVLAVLLGLGAVVHTMIPYLAYVLATAIPAIALTVRRLHDTGRSGGWFFIGLVPFIGDIVLFIFTVLQGDPADNSYGPNPKLA
ncbi:DUF805 domain-containing protein [Peterkaempfera sp. SMS 1(5)a]|uniref:DUF805 domain-containing protein n=1 Tax=Peterkaempfera podocarpi TaxID=3232308 RepID=UPI00366FA476